MTPPSLSISCWNFQLLSQSSGCALVLKACVQKQHCSPALQPSCVQAPANGVACSSSHESNSCARMRISPLQSLAM